jgi:hypothetical protein
MFQDIEGIVQRATTGQIDPTSVGQATSKSVTSMDHQELTRHLQAAAGNAQQNGQPDLAQQIFTLLEKNGRDPAALKAGAIELVQNNPQILQHFAPELAKDILSRL